MAKGSRSRKQQNNSSSVYCRRCMETKREDEFFSAVDEVLDKNGKMSVCKNCCNEIFNNNFGSTKNIRTALLNTCRMLNVAFSERAVSGVQSRIDSAKSRPPSIFGLYKQALAGTGNVNGTDFQVLTFVEPKSEGDEIPSVQTFDDSSDGDALAHFEYEWGKGFSYEDYSWLENKFSEWQSSHKCDTVGERELLKAIVWNLYYTKEAREKNDSTTNLIKEFESLMKTAKLDPSKAGSGASANNTFSEFIRTIEQKEPAEVFGDERDAFKDWQNISTYFENYVVRPIRNFITGSRDFNLEEISDGDDDSDLFVDALSDDLLSHLSDKE